MGSKYTENAIFTVLKTAALSVSPDAYVTGRYMSVPAKFPNVYIRQLDVARPLRGMQLDWQDAQWEVTWEVQVTSNLADGAREEARKIYDAVEGEMRRIYFREISRTPIDEVSRYTIAGRFRRNVGGGDTIPT